MKVVHKWQSSEEKLELCHTYSRLYENMVYVVLHFKSNYGGRGFFYNN